MNWRLSEDGRVHRKRQKKYPNGDLYVGELVDGKRDGEGVLTTADGKVYSGLFYRGLFHGQGKLSWKTAEDGEDGEQIICHHEFTGQFFKGMKKGSGQYVDGHGHIWRGEWINNRFEGRGSLEKKNGERYEGNWINGHLHCDDAVILFSNGDSYEGPVHFDKMNGDFGCYKYAESSGGGSYSGQYRQGLKSGRGTRHYVDNSVYKGHFRNDEPHGVGTMKYAIGPRKQYAGQWQDGDYNGAGTLTFCGGHEIKSISGNFHQGIPKGQIQISYLDGGYFEGTLNIRKRDLFEFSNFSDVSYPYSRQHGKGLRVWASGNTFEGQWLHGKMEEGVYYDKEKRSKYIGTFQNDKKCFGMETWRSPDGNEFRDPCFQWLHKATDVCKYEGHYENGLFHGKGHFIAHDGRSYKGDFIRGLPHGKGVMVFLPDHHLGDKDKMNIGRHGSLYRAYKYEGEYKEGVRHGNGKLIYLDGTEKEGLFVNGQLNP